MVLLLNMHGNRLTNDAVRRVIPVANIFLLMLLILITRIQILLEKYAHQEPQKPPVCAGNKDCDLMGVCISTNTWKNVSSGAKGLKNGDLHISIQPKDGKPNCPPGMKSDGIDLHSGCKKGKSIYLCKKVI